MRWRHLLFRAQIVLAISICHVCEAGAVAQSRDSNGPASGRIISRVPTVLRPQNDKRSPLLLVLEGQKLAEEGTPEALRNSIIKFKEAIDISKASGDKFGHGAALVLLGMSYASLGVKQHAVDALTEALPLTKETDDQSLQTLVLSSMGAVYASMGFYKKGIEYLDQTVPLLQGPEQRQALASTLGALGSAYVMSSERRKGLEYLNQSLSLQMVVGDRNAQAITLEAIALSHASMSEYKEALDLLDQSLSLRKSLGKPGAEFTSIRSIGRVYADLGDGDKAITNFQQALSISRSVKDPSREADALNELGQVYFQRGNKKLAVEYFDQALQLAQAADDRGTEAAVLHNSAAFYESIGDLPKSLRLYNQALAISEAEEHHHNKATCLVNIGNVYYRLGELRKAMDYSTQALATFRLLEERHAESSTLESIGRTYGSMGESTKALDYMGEALKISRSIGDLYGEANTLQSIGEIYRFLGYKQNALSYLTQALPIMQKVKNRRGEAIILNGIGIVSESLGEDQNALSNLNQSLTIARDLENHRDEASTLSNIAFLYEHKGDLKNAIEFFLLSIEQRERLRTAARLEEFKFDLAGLDSEVYTHAVLLNQRVGQATRAFDLVERARARTFLDQLGNVHPDVRKVENNELVLREQTLALELASLDNKLKEEYAKPSSSLNGGVIATLENNLAARRREYEELLTDLKIANPEYASLRSVNTLSLTEVQKLLGEDTTLVSYFVTADKTLAYVIGRDFFQTVEIPVKESDLVGAIGWFRSFPSLRDPQSLTLKQLHSWLILPVKPLLKTPLVGIIPHSVLHRLPFAALTDGQHYFGDEYTLFYLPSASVLPFIQKKSKLKGARVLALSQSQAQGLPLLHYADEEGRTVAGIFNTQAVTTDQASKAGFLNRTGNYDILHIAAHAELSAANPLFSRIMLGSDTSGGGTLEIREIYDLDLSKASLVVLSACNTQLGAQSKADDIVALNRAFIYAGASTVIASLWTVDDRATGLLMRSFYTHLKRGAGKAEALRKAQSETRRQYPNPYYWAAFVLTGDAGSGNRPRSAGRLAGAARRH